MRITEPSESPIRHWIAAPSLGDLRCNKKRFDVRKLGLPEVRMEVTRRLNAIPLADWRMDVNAHADYVQSHFHNVLDEIVPWQPGAPRSAHVSDAAWELRQKKQSLKGRTANRRRDFRRDLLGLGWDIWRQDGRKSDVWRRQAIGKLILFYEVTAAAITLATKAMKDIIKQDKIQKLRNICADVGRSPPQDIMRKVKCLQLGRRKPKKWMSHLPGLTMTDAADYA